MKVLNYGSLNRDFVYTVDHIMRPGETQSSSNMEVFCGGKGLNQSLALRKAGVEVYHGGTIGEDGQVFLDLCKEYGIDTTYIERISGESGHTVIQVDKNAENCILLFGGTNQRQSKEHIKEVLSNFKEGDLLLLQNEVNHLDYIIDQAYERGMVIVLNPSPYDKALEACDLSKVSIFLLNEVEGGEITGKKGESEILEAMSSQFPHSKVVLTLGTKGAIYQEGRKVYRQKSYPVEAVDTTAAGDTFTGYFIAGIIEGMSIETILERCAKASAIAVSRKGATDSIPYTKEVESFMKN